MSYAFVEEHQDQWPVPWVCDALGVSTSGYYSRLDRDASPQQQRREKLTVEVEAVHAEVKARYGRPRIHAELAGRGHDCCVNTVARIMREAGIAARTRRKFRHTTDSNHDRPVADNLLARDFAPSGPNRSWVADITAIPTREGWLYLAAVEDLFSRMVVGWSMSETMGSRSVVDALGVAVLGRLKGSSSSGLVAHSDRGGQYASEHPQSLLAREGIVCGMSRRGNCWDNAPVESFLASLKKELVHGEDYATRAQARSTIFEYIQGLYNRTRRHSTLGYVSPVQFEAAHPQ